MKKRFFLDKIAIEKQKSEIKMTEEVALRRYEDFLIGKKDFQLKSPSFVEKKVNIKKGTVDEIDMLRDAKLSKEKDALAIIRYAITGILGWTPDEAFYYFNEKTLKALKLEQVCKHIEFPKDLKPKVDYWWYIYKAFPAQVKYNPNERVLNLYRQMMKNEIKHFPKGVFEGREGSDKLNLILHYFITENIPASTIEDLYDAFGNRAEAVKFLKEGKLYHAYKDKYSSPIDWLHDSLGEDANNLYYRFQQFNELFPKVEKELKAIKKLEGKKAKSSKQIE